MKETLIIVFLGAAWLFPVFYAYKRLVKDKMLFLFSSYGAELVITMLLAGVGVPIYVFSIFMLPQLIEFDDQFQWIAWPIEWVLNWYWLVTPLLLFIIPRGIYARYKRYFSSE